MLIKGEHYSNVNYICKNYTGSKKRFEFTELCEYEYLSNIFRNLRRILASNFTDYEFLIYAKINQSFNVDDRGIIPDTKNPNIIVFYIGDETGEIPSYLASRCRAIFKVHLQNDATGNVFYFPLGYANGNRLNVLSVMDRTVDVFFSGAINHSRIELYQGLSGMMYIPSSILLLLKKFIRKDLSDKLPNSKIFFTSGFKSGLNQQAYSALLHDCKIALCPYGFVNPETFRHYEAMRAGCIVITPKMPRVRSFSGAPVIEIENWGQVRSAIKELVCDQKTMYQYHLKILQWWEDKCSEESVANYVVKTFLQYT